MFGVLAWKGNTAVLTGPQSGAKGGAFSLGSLDLPSPANRERLSTRDFSLSSIYTGGRRIREVEPQLPHLIPSKELVAGSPS